MPFDLDGRDELILNLRKRGETLQNIGTRLDLTRERIRQIEEKAKKRVARSSEQKELIRAARSYLGNRGYVSNEVCLRLITAISPGSTAGPQLLSVGICLDAIGSDSDTVRVHSVLMTDEDVEQVFFEIASVCVSLVIEKGDFCAADVLSILIPDQGSDPRRRRLIEGLIENCGDDIQKEVESISTWTRKGAKATALAEQVLMEAGQPLHWTDVAERVNQIRRDLGLKLLAERGIHNTLVQHDTFSYQDAGTYGLAEWAEAVPFIKVAIRQSLEQSGHPQSAGQICDAVQRSRDGKESSVMMYLNLNTEFYKSRTGKYGLREWLPERATISTDRDLVECPISARRIAGQDN